MPFAHLVYLLKYSEVTAFASVGPLLTAVNKIDFKGNVKAPWPPTKIVKRETWEWSQMHLFNKEEFNKNK